MERHVIAVRATRKRGLQKRTHGGELRLGSISNLAAPTSAAAPGQPDRATIFYRGHFDLETHRAIEALREGKYASTNVKLLILSLAYPHEQIACAEDDPCADATLDRYNMVLQRLGVRYEAGLLVYAPFGVDGDYWRAALFIDRSIQSDVIRETLRKIGIALYSVQEPDTEADLIEAVISVPVGPTPREFGDFKALSKQRDWPEFPKLDSGVAHLPDEGAALWHAPPETAGLVVEGDFDRASMAAMSAAASGAQADLPKKFILIWTVSDAAPDWDNESAGRLHRHAVMRLKWCMSKAAVAYSSGIFSHVFWRSDRLGLQIWRAIVEVPRELSADAVREALTSFVGQAFIVREYVDAREMIGWMLGLLFRLDDKFMREWSQLANAEALV